jgi:hypothetical protein
MINKKGRPRKADDPFYILAKATGLLSRVHFVGRCVIGRFGCVLDGFAGVFNGVVGGVEGVVDGVVGSSRIGFDSVFNSGVLDGIGSLRFARGQAEREDRNGQCNLLHDRSIPCMTRAGPLGVRRAKLGLPTFGQASAGQ